MADPRLISQYAGDGEYFQATAIIIEYSLRGYNFNLTAFISNKLLMSI